MRRLIMLGWAGVLAVAAAGCNVVKIPEAPQEIIPPKVEVVAVQLLDSSGEATRYDIRVKLTNPNKFKLPLIGATYRLTVDGATFDGSQPPNATLPRAASVAFSLPAVLPGPATGAGQYTAQGTIVMAPENQIREFMWEVGVPHPSVSFKSSGAIEALGAAEAAKVGPAGEPAEPPTDASSDGDDDE